jgi:hypothetical protein
MLVVAAGERASVRFSLIAVAIVISWSGIAFAQQPSAPTAGPPRTCSQQVAVCTRFCDNASIHNQGRNLRQGSQAADEDNPCKRGNAAERKGMNKPLRYAHGKVLPVLLLRDVKPNRRGSSTGKGLITAQNSVFGRPLR